jgi:hypothetical protein
MAIQYLGVAVVYHINDFLESHQNLLAGPVDLNKENCRYFYPIWSSVYRTFILSIRT